VTRASYTWPRKFIDLQFHLAILTLLVFDISDAYTNQDMGTINPFNLSNTLSSYPKTIASSPPPALFTPEQRELKRQRDLARRESKTKLRRDRSISNPYQSSQIGTPDLLPRTVADFSSTMATSLSAQSSPTFANVNYMPAMASQISSSESPELFGAPFPL
jgi:hypothetical protein